MKNLRIRFRVYSEYDYYLGTETPEIQEIVVHPPFDLGEWLENNGVASCYDSGRDAFLVSDDEGDISEIYQVISREETDEDLYG